MFPAQSQQPYKAILIGNGKNVVASHLQHVNTEHETGVANLELTQPGHDN